MSQDGWVDTVWLNLVGKHDFVTISWREGYNLMTPQQKADIAQLARTHLHLHAAKFVAYVMLAYAMWCLRACTLGASLLAAIAAAAAATAQASILKRLATLLWLSRHKARILRHDN